MDCMYEYPGENLGTRTADLIIIIYMDAVYKCSDRSKAPWYSHVQQFSVIFA